MTRNPITELPMQSQHKLLEDAIWVAMQAAFVSEHMTYRMPYDRVTVDKVRSARRLLTQAWEELRLAQQQEIERQRESCAQPPPQ